MILVELTRIGPDGNAFGVSIDPIGIDYITVPDEGTATGTIVCLSNGQKLAVSENYFRVRDKWLEARQPT